MSFHLKKFAPSFCTICITDVTHCYANLKSCIKILTFQTLASAIQIVRAKQVWQHNSQVVEDQLLRERDVER